MMMQMAEDNEVMEKRLTDRLELSVTNAVEFSVTNTVNKAVVGLTNELHTWDYKVERDGETVATSSWSGGSTIGHGILGALGGGSAFPCGV